MSKYLQISIGMTEIANGLDDDGVMLAGLATAAGLIPEAL